MITQLLLPQKCRLAGFILLPFAASLLIASYYFDFSLSFLNHTNKAGAGTFDNAGVIFSKNFSADYTGTVAILLTIVSLSMIAFSREKNEDEYIVSVRLRALQISVYANYIILGITALMFFSTSFLMVMQINLFTILILFIIIYQYQLHIRPKFSKNAAN